MPTEEISFLNGSDSYCVCFIDMIGSTKVVSQIATVPDKIRKYYSIFLNSMSKCNLACTKCHSRKCSPERKYHCGRISNWDID